MLFRKVYLGSYSLLERPTPDREWRQADERDDQLQRMADNLKPMLIELRAEFRRLLEGPKRTVTEARQPRAGGASRGGHDPQDSS